MTALVVGVGMGCGWALDVSSTPVDGIVISIASTESIIINDDNTGQKDGWEGKTITVTANSGATTVTVGGTSSYGGDIAFRNMNLTGTDTNTATLDIQNGIRISRPKLILVATPGKWTGQNLTGWVNWYCYGYTFKDAAGHEVDLGLFETRDELFAALRQYYDKEIAAGAMKKAEADGLYNKVAHNVRLIDEVPLKEKLVSYKNLYAKELYNPFYFGD